MNDERPRGRSRLTAEPYRVTQGRGTEAPFPGSITLDFEPKQK
jgi:hypothetical protein